MHLDYFLFEDSTFMSLLLGVDVLLISSLDLILDLINDRLSFLYLCSSWMVTEGITLESAF